MFFKSKRQKSIEFEKKLYETSIMQNLYETIAELEDRIKELEQR